MEKIRQLVNDGISSKVNKLTDESQLKLQKQCKRLLMTVTVVLFV